MPVLWHAKSRLQVSQEKQDQIKNPSRYLISAAMRETGGASTQPALMALPAPVSAPAGRAMHAPYAAANVDESKIHRRATWLNANVFPDRPIDEEAGEGSAPSEACRV